MLVEFKKKRQKKIIIIIVIVYNYEYYIDYIIAVVYKLQTTKKNINYISMAIKKKTKH